MNNIQMRTVARTGSACLKKAFVTATKRARTTLSPSTVLVLSCSSDARWTWSAGSVLDFSRCNSTPALHGWPLGAGDVSDSLAVLSHEAHWLVFEVALSDIVKQDGKVEFARAVVRYNGDMVSATRYLEQHNRHSKSLAVIGACRKVGNRRRVSVGALGIASAGAYGKASAGDYGTALAGTNGHAVAGESATALAGDFGTACTGDFGTASAGDFGAAITGDGGIATVTSCGSARAGVVGIAIAGDYSTACAGERGTAYAGIRGTASAGERGEIHLKYWDAKAGRHRTVTGYIGEDGLEANTLYRLSEKNSFVRAAQTVGGDQP
jgi:hypothetical protein